MPTTMGVMLLELVLPDRPPYSIGRNGPWYERAFVRVMPREQLSSVKGRVSLHENPDSVLRIMVLAFDSTYDTNRKKSNSHKTILAAFC